MDLKPVDFDKLLQESPRTRREFSKDEVFIIDEGMRRGVSYIKLAQVLNRNPASVRNFIAKNMNADGVFEPEKALTRISQRESLLLAQAANARSHRKPQRSIADKVDELLEICKEILTKM